MLCLGIAICQIAEAQTNDWSHWRGAMRNGLTSAASGWNGERWIAPQPSWTAEVGDGASSPLIVAGRIFTLGNRDGRDVVHCLSASTGATEWVQSYPAPAYGRNATGDEGLYSGPSATPEYDLPTKLLFTCGADGDLCCWNTAAGGNLVWRRNLYDDYQMPRRPKVGRSGQRDYGYTCAPLVHREWLLVEAGGPKGTIVALNKRTGKEVWRSQARQVAGHTGGMSLMTIEGTPCLAVMTFEGLLVVRLDDGRAGETVATYPWVTDFANNIASVAAHDESLLITSAYNQHAICKLRITLGGAKQIWRQPFPSKACTPVIHQGAVYVAWDRLRSLDWETGELFWEGPVVADAGSCVVTGDRKLIVWAAQGDLYLFDLASTLQEKPRQLAHIRGLADSDVWPHVAVTDREIVCRDRLGKLMRFAIPR